MTAGNANLVIASSADVTVMILLPLSHCDGHDSKPSNCIKRHPFDPHDTLSLESRYPLFIVAPEGTTKHKHCLLTFAKGAFAPGLPVMPVLLKYSSVHFNPGWGIVYTAWHFFRLFNQFKNNVEVEVLPIYYPSPGTTTAEPIVTCMVCPHLRLARVSRCCNAKAHFCMNISAM